MMRIYFLIMILVLGASVLFAEEKVVSASPAVAEAEAALDESAAEAVPVKDTEEKNVVAKVMTAFKQGGAVMWFLLALSVAGLTFVLERIVGLRKSVHITDDFVAAISSGEGMGQDKCTASVVAGSVFARRKEGLAEMERTLQEELERVLWNERKNLRPVGMVANVAPMIGLLGTVLGLIQAFRLAAEKGMDNPAHFAEGIYLALYTTAFGLMVAIPFLVAYQLLRGRVESVVRAIEDVILQNMKTSDELPVAEEKTEINSDADTTEDATAEAKDTVEQDVDSIPEAVNSDEIEESADASEKEEKPETDEEQEEKQEEKQEEVKSPSFMLHALNSESTDDDSSRQVA